VLDFTPPQVISVNPPVGAQNVPTNTVLQAAFSEPIDPLSLDPSNVQLIEYADYQPIPISVALDASGRLLTVTPQLPLYVGTHHTLSVGGTLALSLAFPPTFPIIFTGSSVATAVGSLLLIGPVGGLVSIRYSLRIEPLRALGLLS